MPALRPRARTNLATNFSGRRTVRASKTLNNLCASAPGPPPPRPPPPRRRRVALTRRRAPRANRRAFYHHRKRKRCLNGILIELHMHSEILCRQPVRSNVQSLAESEEPAGL